MVVCADIVGAFILWLTPAAGGLLPKHRVTGVEVMETQDKHLGPYESARIAAQAVAASSPNKLVAQKWTPRAVEFLKQAQAAGYFDDKAKVEELKTDKTFAALQGRDEFKQLVQELENEGRNDK
jgi:hypothetical protein